MAITPSPWSLADRSSRRDRRAVGAFGGGGLLWAAGVGQADLAARGQGAAGLAGFLGQQPAAFRRVQQPLVDLAVVEGAGGDQVVEVAGRLPQLAVALADRGGGDPGQLLGQGRPRITVTRAVSDSWELNRTGSPLDLARLQPLKQHRGNLGGWAVQVSVRGPPVGVAAGVAAGWGDHIATPAPPIHMLQPVRTDVAQAAGGPVVVPATPAGADQRPGALQAMGGRQRPDDLGTDGAVDIQDIEAVAGGQADVGLGVAGPPGQDPGPVTGGVGDPVGDQAAQGVLADLAAARIPTRTADPCHRSLGVTSNRLEAGSVGQGVVEGQDGDAAAGVAEGGVAQQRVGAGPGHQSGTCWWSSPAASSWRASRRPWGSGLVGGRAVPACPAWTAPPAGGGAALAPQGHVGGGVGWP